MWFEGVDYWALGWTAVLGVLGAGTSTNFRGWGGDSAGAGAYGGMTLLLMALGWIPFCIVSAWSYGIGHGFLTLGYVVLLFILILSVFEQMKMTRDARWRAKLAAEKASREA